MTTERKDGSFQRIHSTSRRWSLDSGYSIFSILPVSMWDFNWNWFRGAIIFSTTWLIVRLQTRQKWLSVRRCLIDWMMKSRRLWHCSGLPAPQFYYKGLNWTCSWWVSYPPDDPLKPHFDVILSIIGYGTYGTDFMGVLHLMVSPHDERWVLSDFLGRSWDIPSVKWLYNSLVICDWENFYPKPSWPRMSQCHPKRKKRKVYFTLVVAIRRMVRMTM